MKRTAICLAPAAAVLLIMGSHAKAANPTAPGIPNDDVADLIVNPDGTATLDPDGQAINGFILSSLGGNFTGMGTLPPAFFTVNTTTEASAQFLFTISGDTPIDLGQLYNTPPPPIVYSDLDFNYTVDGEPDLFHGTCIGCVNGVTTFNGIFIDEDLQTIDITGDIEVVDGAKVEVTPSYFQEPASVELILAVTHTGVRNGEFANDKEHLRDGIFVDGITYGLNEVLVGLLQAVPGDLDGSRHVDSDDIQNLLATNSFNNPGAGPGPNGEWSWGHGDENGDGLVDSDDIQAMLGAGFFNTGQYAASVTVPEPSTIVLTVLALIGLVGYGWRRRA